MTTSERCGHDACLCTRPYPTEAYATGVERIDPNAEFCSRRCADHAQGEHGDGACLCGHPQCARPASEGIPPMQ